MAAVTGWHGLDISGVTANRPVNAEEGYTFFDTTTSEFLVWNGTAWVDTATSSVAIIVTTATITTAIITTATIGTVNVGTSLVMGNAINMVVGTSTGTKIGTAVGQKLGLWGATPVVQPAGGDQADQGGMSTSAPGDLVATQNTGWGASTEAGFDSIASKIDSLVADVAALDTLLTAVRTALVDTGIMKGAA